MSVLSEKSIAIDELWHVGQSIGIPRLIAIIAMITLRSNRAEIAPRPFQYSTTRTVFGVLDRIALLDQDMVDAHLAHEFGAQQILILYGDKHLQHVCFAL